jgi:hypothetical protein
MLDAWASARHARTRRCAAMNAASLRAAGAGLWSSQEWHAAVVVVSLPTLALPMDGQIAVAAGDRGAVVCADPRYQQQALLAFGHLASASADLQALLAPARGQRGAQVRPASGTLLRRS